MYAWIGFLIKGMGLNDEGISDTDSAITNSGTDQEDENGFDSPRGNPK